MNSVSIYLTQLGTRAIVLWAKALVVALCLWLSQVVAAQAPSAPSGDSWPQSAEARHVAEIEHRLIEVTAALGETNRALRNYESEVKALRSELDALMSNSGSTVTGSQTAATSANELTGSNPTDAVGNLDELGELHDEQVAQQAEIKQLDQTKVEISSKYPLRLNGLVLFNAFANAGVVDNVELPAIARYRYPGSSHGSNGGTLRQTELGLEALGPRVAGANTSAELSVDFFGGSAMNGSGYSASAGTLRMRRAIVSMNWDQTTVSAGYTAPLISPLSPTSFATVAVPSLSGSGNLWTWSPQIAFEHRVLLSDTHSIGLEGGIIYPNSPGYASTQLVSPVEASRRPAYEGRVSYRGVPSSSDSTNRLVMGLSGYSGEQFYDSNTRIHSWVIAGDWSLPITTRFELSGEAYRGLAIGGLGGGAYKDTVSGVDATTGLPRTAAVDTAGGWSQATFRVASEFKANAIFGIDDAFSRSFDGLILDSTTNPLIAYARNSSIIGNVIYRPRTYLILSPEYRHITSWRYTGRASVANIFTMSAGYQF